MCAWLYTHLLSPFGVEKIGAVTRFVAPEHREAALALADLGTAVGPLVKLAFLAFGFAVGLICFAAMQDRTGRRGELHGRRAGVELETGRKLFTQGCELLLGQFHHERFTCAGDFSGAFAFLQIAIATAFSQ